MGTLSTYSILSDAFISLLSVLLENKIKERKKPKKKNKEEKGKTKKVMENTKGKTNKVKRNKCGFI